MTAAITPDMPLLTSVDACCWAATGWEDAGEGTVRDARTTTRGQAAAFVASETTGHLPDIRVWKRHIKLWTRQDAWDHYGRERYADDLQWGPNGRTMTLAEALHAAPQNPPADWQPDDYAPAWEFVGRSHPDAIPVWIVGFKGDLPPGRSIASSEEEV